MILKDDRLANDILIASNFISIALCAILIWVLVYFVLKERKSQRHIAQAREQLRAYALEAKDRAIIDERNRISRRIYDSVGHTLTAQSIQLNNAIAFWQSDPDKAYGFSIESIKLVTTALKEIRYSVAILSSDPLEGKKIKAAIGSLLQEFSQRTKIISHYVTYDFDYPFSERVKTNIYRIVREALNNIAEHSKATEVRVNLQTSFQYLKVSITDNGRGFNPERNTTGMGIREMQERVAALSGSLMISSSIGEGCTITINIPCQRLSQSK